jgi:DMSO/TMAO reductase YedYZ molybdopterin-dependent catalytic subunit
VRVRSFLGALCGLLACAIGLGAGELTAALVRPEAAPVVVVANRLILLTPGWLKRLAIDWFGTNDKNALGTGIFAFLAVFAAVVGIRASRRWWEGLIGVAVFGLLGIYCALTDHAARGSDVVPSIVAAVVTAIALLRLVARIPLTRIPAARGAAAGGPAARQSAAKGWSAGGSSAPPSARRPSRSPQPGLAPPTRPWSRSPGRPTGSDRRRFLVTSAGVAGAAVVTGFGGRAWQHHRFDAIRSREAVVLPPAQTPAPALPLTANLAKNPTPFITPNSKFYRIDTAYSVPQVVASTWKLRIYGMVERPLEFTLKDLLAMPLIERYITLACVSNEVGGGLISTALFRGTLLAPLLRQAGVNAKADQLVCRSVDGMTIGAPVAEVMDGRDAMLAVGMNGQALPIAHGFPVRMVVPGLYGYVSACKWIKEIEVSTFSAFSAYWVREGWIPKAPIQLSSRIDTPSSGKRVSVGETVTIAGVAWHQHVGIKAVQVQVDDGPWLDARLGSVPTTDTWRQWVTSWKVAGQGPHHITVRAVDERGAVQSTQHRGPYPGASSGLHRIGVTAS